MRWVDPGDGRLFPMEVSAFWSEQCPTRSAGLNHRHSDRCADGHLDDQCCECGDLGRNWRPNSMQAPPPLDVAARLRQIGFTPEPEDPLTVHLHEQKHASGYWKGETYVPGAMTGDPNGPGRGALTSRQQDQLRARAGWQRYLDNRDAGPADA